MINYYEKFAAKVLDSDSIKIYSGLFDRQVEVFDDVKVLSDKRVTLGCGRRAGKTTGIGRLLIQAMVDNPKSGEDDSIIIYIGPTKSQAKRLMWGRLQVISEQYNIPIRFNGTELIAYHDNGSQLWIMGGDDDRDVARMRGPSYRLVVIDECQSVGASLDELIIQVLEPALADYHGNLVMAGTPSAACVGYFHDACTGVIPGWTNYHWTIMDNPMFPRWRGNPDWKQAATEFLAQYRQSKKIDVDNPSYQREWLGKWVNDIGGLVYKYDSLKNSYTDLPDDDYHWQYVMGVDFGFDDAFAIVIWAFSTDLPDAYVVDTYRKSGETLTDWAHQINIRVDKYNPIARKADTGALGKAIVKELNTRFGTGLTPAEKAGKLANIELYNTGLRDEHIYIQSGSDYEKEISILQWDPGRKKEDHRFANDLCDAGLYGYRELYHWLYKPKEKIPEYGTPEYYELEAEKMYQQDVEVMRHRENKAWWEV